MNAKTTAISKLTKPKNMLGQNAQSSSYSKAMKSAHESLYGPVPSMGARAPKPRSGNLTEKNHTYLRNKVLSKYHGTKVNKPQ